MKTLYESILSKRSINTSTMMYDDILSNLKKHGVDGDAAVDRKFELVEYDFREEAITLENTHYLTTDSINYLHNLGILNIRTRNYDTPCCIQSGPKSEKSIKGMNVTVCPGELIFDNYKVPRIDVSNCKFTCNQIESFGKIMFDNCVIDVLHLWDKHYTPDGYLRIYSRQTEGCTHFNRCTIKAHCIIIYTKDSDEFEEMKTRMSKGTASRAKKILNKIRGVYDCTIFDVLAPYFNNCKFEGIKQPDVIFETLPNNSRCIYFTTDPRGDTFGLERLKDGYYVSDDHNILK